MVTKRELLKHEQWIRQICRKEIRNYMKQRPIPLVIDSVGKRRKPKE